MSNLRVLTAQQSEYTPWCRHDSILTHTVRDYHAKYYVPHNVSLNLPDLKLMIAMSPYRWCRSATGIIRYPEQPG